MSDIEIIVYVEKISNLVHSSKNPRYLKAKRKQDLEKSLTDFPEMKEIREIVIDENNLILAGDKRVYILEEMGYTDVKVKKVTGLSEKKKREFIIKDNDHNGDWDPDIIANEWDPEELADWGVPKFTMPVANNGNNTEENERKSHDVTCPNCQFVFDPSENDE